MSAGLSDIGADCIALIFDFLHFNEALNICLTNKYYYNNFLIFCYEHSAVPIALKKQEKKYYQKIGVFDKIKNISCIGIFNNWNKINNLIPSRVNNLYLNKNINIPFGKKIFFNTVKILTFDKKSKFNYNIGGVNLPQNIKKISFGKKFNKNIDKLPDSIEVIEFCKNARFNLNIKKYPANLKEIYFGDFFNYSIHNMPPNVRIIYFSNNSKFNADIEYPPELEKITFGRAFNKDITPIFLCKKLKEIKFHIYAQFNLPIYAESLSLKKIYFGASFNNSIDMINCEALRSIEFHNKSRFCENILISKTEVIHGKKFNGKIIIYI